METLPKKTLLQDSDDASEDDQNASPTRRTSKRKHKRKTSMVTARETEKPKRRPSKARHSLAPNMSDMPDALQYLRTIAAKNDALTMLRESKPEEKKEEIPGDLTKLTIEEKDSDDVLDDEARAAAAVRNKYSIGNLTSTMNQKITFWSCVPEKNAQLEDHLENDNEFDITGILNLSAMNVTDSDLPTIVQRAFWSGPKKCTGLILRDNALTADGVRMIVDTIIAGRACLKYLSFSSNPGIGDAGIEHIVRLLQNRRSIIFLALPRTGITDRGVKLLADVLCGNDPEQTNPSSLEKLYISFNKGITDESVDVLLQILEQNQRLKILSIEHCSLSEKAFRRLKHAAMKLKKKKFSLSS